MFALITALTAFLTLAVILISKLKTKKNNLLGCHVIVSSNL